MGECTEKESSLLNFSGRPLQLVYCSDCAWESSPEMNCCQLQWLLCLGSPSRNPHPSQIQVIIKWPVQPSALLHKKHRQKRVYDAWVCVQQLRLDHKIAVCCPSPSCFPFMASSLLSACILQGLTTFSGSAHVIVCKHSWIWLELSTRIQYGGYWVETKWMISVSKTNDYPSFACLLWRGAYLIRCVHLCHLNMPICTEKSQK